MFADFYISGRRIAKNVKFCSTMSSKVLGLMFVSSPGNGAFLPGVKDIHMNFVRFGLRVIWLDEKRKVVKIADAKPWRLYYGPYNARHVLELPTTNRSKIKEGDKISIITNQGNGKGKRIFR